MTNVNPIREAVSRLPGNWYKGYFFDPNRENFCGIGMTCEVLSQEYGTHVWDHEKPFAYFVEQEKAILILNRMAGEQYPDRTDGRENFPKFNDHEDTTEEEVVAVMEKAAVKWDELYG